MAAYFPFVRDGSRQIEERRNVTTTNGGFVSSFWSMQSSYVCELTRVSAFVSKFMGELKNPLYLEFLSSICMWNMSFSRISSLFEASGAAPWNAMPPGSCSSDHWWSTAGPKDWGWMPRDPRNVLYCCGNWIYFAKDNVFDFNNFQRF